MRRKIFKTDLKKKMLFMLFFITLINCLVLVSWFYLKIIPLVNNLNTIKNDIVNNELKSNYENTDELYKNIKNITTNYGVRIFIRDSNNKYVDKFGGSEGGIFLSDYLIHINDDVYLLEIYWMRRSGVTGIIIELILFEIFIVAILMVFTFIITRAKVLTPVNKIIMDIRNYKFGIKPVRNELNSEFDLIKNEFVNLTDSIEKEKSEQNRIIASISHDIKTPLTSIIGYSNLIMTSNLTKSEILKYNQKINDKSLHIKEILLTFDDYLANSSNQTLKLDSVSIQSVVDDLNSDYKVDLESIGIKFNVTTHISNNIIKIDIVKMRRVFSNIISNSIRVLSNGGIITIDIRKNDKYYIILVSDNGPGVDEEIIDKIFEPMFTTDKSRKISGLGLSICREFVLMHKGSIRAYNNNGLTIEIKLPL